MLAYVELAEGVRMLTNIVGCAPDDVRIGMPVEVVFDDVTPTVTLPKFKPANRPHREGVGIEERRSPAATGLTSLAHHRTVAGFMILDLHAHSDASEDSRAPLETYLKWLQRKRDLLPIDGIVLTEHRQWDPTADYPRISRTSTAS